MADRNPETDPQFLAEYIMNARPEVGDEFVVRVLEAQLEPSKSEPWLRVYIRRANRDCKTMDFRISYELEEPWADEQGGERDDDDTNN